MFSHESTENLLDNLESELSEMIELEAVQKSPPKPTPKKDSPKKRTPPPVPARRNVQSSIELHQPAPVPATRRASLLDKNEKNDENEIIQMHSLNSDHDSNTSGSQQGTSKQNTVIVVNERTRNSVQVVHESGSSKALKDTNETFFVIKHGKWATEHDEIHSLQSAEDEIKVVRLEEETSGRKLPSAEAAKKKKKLVRKKQDTSQSSTTPSSHRTSADSSSTESSSLEDSPQLVKKKSKKGKDRRRQKKEKSDEQTASSCTESGGKKDVSKLDMTSSDRAIGVFVNCTGPMKYKKTLKSPKIKISFYNEDNGRQIDESWWTKCGRLSINDFDNLVCSWNEAVTVNLDIKRLREIYNNVLVFFEMISIENVSVCWAFLKVLSRHSLNIDKKVKLQFYEYQKPPNTCFGLFNRKLPTEISIFEQHQLTRRKFPSFLNVYVKDLNQSAAADDDEKSTQATPAKIQEGIEGIEGMQHFWRKIPGQACKTPNRQFQKLQLHDKGSLLVKFSHDGNFMAFSEVSANGHLLHIHQFPQMAKVFTMLEHSDLIHDIDWLKQKTYACQRVVTASADFTAIVWRLEDDAYTYTILPHPSFVYASKFLQNDNSGNAHVVTGGRDNVVRIWKNRTGMHSFELVQELKHPRTNSVTFITAIATKSADTFFTSTSTGDVVEWTSSGTEYQMNRHFRLEGMRDKLINCMQLNPRGNKICLRVQDTNDSELSNTIFVVGIPTGSITQKYQQVIAKSESQGSLAISPCGTQIFATNGCLIRHYQLVNGNVVTPDNDSNFVVSRLSLGHSGFVASLDYHPKDFYLACSTYGASHNSITIYGFESTDSKNPIEQLKSTSQESILRTAVESRQVDQFSNIIRRMDDVFLSGPMTGNAEDQQSILGKSQEGKNSNCEDNTFTVDSKRSKTYTVSKGPATFTIHNGTYEIQKNDDTDEDETTISESLN